MPRAASRSATEYVLSPFRFISSMARSNNCASIEARARLTEAAAVTDSHPRSASMSSIIRRTSISSSTTRTRRPESNLFITRAVGRRKVDCADHAIRAVVEVYRALQLVSQTALNHARAEPLPGRWRHVRAVLFLPAQKNPIALGMRLDRRSEERRV